MAFREGELRRIFGLAIVGASAWSACSTTGAVDDDAGFDAADAGAGDASDASDARPADGSPFGTVDSSIEWCEAGPPEWVSTCGSCCEYVYVPCGIPSSIYVDEAGVLWSCDAICGDAGVWGCALSAPPDASLEDAGAYVMCACTGRRPEGFRAGSVRSTLGGYFAEMARLEAASVYAFERLECELRDLRAPRSLRARARRAIADERRHTRAMASIASRLGARVRLPRAPRFHARRVERMAVENIVEGCVRETYGALLATWQASNARDPRVRRAMAAIARDETRHAAIASSVADFLATKLDPAARRRVERAHRRAVAGLTRAVATPPPPFAGEVGLPSRGEARALVATLERLVWASAS